MKLLSKSLPILALLMSGMLQAQTPFWSETFTAGIPAGWTSVDASGQGFNWQWCAEPNPTPPCSPVFNGQQPFAATTAATGFVHVDSDGGLAAPLPQNHVSRLTTAAINCTGKSQVWLQFQNHIGTYVEPLATNAIVRVSTNLTTWTNFTPFPTFTGENFFSPNPYFATLDISSVAANQSTVYIQWQWTANFEYMWDMDDVNLFDANPSPKNDIVLGDFFYAPSSFAQPVSQIATDTFAFGANLSNVGADAQTNVVLRAAVTTDTNVELWADSLVIPTLATTVVDSFFELPNRYAPELAVGAYQIKYTVRSDNQDERPADNSGSDFFLVTNNIFSKEAQVQSAIRPQTLGTGWYVGNLYQMSAGSLENYQATTATFTFGADAAEIPVTDVEASIYLFRVKDGVNFATAGGFDRTTFFSPDLVWKGLANYAAPDTMVGGLLQTVQLLDVDLFTAGVKLDKGARYLVVVGYADQSRFAYHAFNEDVNMFFASTFTFSDQWYPNGFGVEENAVLRMNISLVTTTDDKPLAESAMRVLPNPVSDMLNLAVRFDKPTNATITIADMNGRVIEFEDREALTNDNLSYPVRQLAPGTYLARIATAEGTLTKKFVKL
jgi:hypothetical protein